MASQPMQLVKPGRPGLHPGTSQAPWLSYPGLDTMGAPLEMVVKSVHNALRDCSGRIACMLLLFSMFFYIKGTFTPN